MRFKVGEENKNPKSNWWATPNPIKGEDLTFIQPRMIFFFKGRIIIINKILKRNKFVCLIEGRLSRFKAILYGNLIDKAIYAGSIEDHPLFRG